MVPMDVTSECLAAMAHICRGLLVKPSLRSRVTRDDTLMLLLRVMTGVIILYDHIDPYGVFRKASKLDAEITHFLGFLSQLCIKASLFPIVFMFLKASIFKRSNWTDSKTAVDRPDRMSTVFPVSLRCVIRFRCQTGSDLTKFTELPALKFPHN
ncbi:hypothetical protein ACTXT7_011844 [Hymenolepis weldensis]